MYFTNATGGRSFYSCSGNNVPDLLRKIPSDAEVPLPPNPVLDDIADGKNVGPPSFSSSFSSFQDSKGSKPTERRHGNEGRNRYRGATGGPGAGNGRDVSGLVETERNFMAGAASSDDVRRNPYANYRIQKDGSNSPSDDPVEWTATGGGRDPSRPALESDYVNPKRPEEGAEAEGDLAYEYAGVPDVGAADDDRLLQDYMEEVAGQRSRYRHRHPSEGSPSAAAAYYQRYPLSKYGVGTSRDEEEGEEANRRRLYPEEYDVGGSQGYDTRSRDIDPPRAGSSDELQRISKLGSGSTAAVRDVNQSSTSAPESGKSSARQLIII